MSSVNSAISSYVIKYPTGWGFSSRPLFIAFNSSFVKSKLLECGLKGLSWRAATSVGAAAAAACWFSAFTMAVY